MTVANLFVFAKGNSWWMLLKHLFVCFIIYFFDKFRLIHSIFGFAKPAPSTWNKIIYPFTEM